MGKKTLPLREAVQAAAIFFEKNTEVEVSLKLMEQAQLQTEKWQGADRHPAASARKLTDMEAAFLWEWRAFVFCSVLHALKENAPSAVFVEFLRATHELMQRCGYSEEQTNFFVDDALGCYASLLMQENLSRQCPDTFFQRLLNKELLQSPKPAVVRISSVMAMVLAAALDTFEQYEYLLD